MFSSITSYLFGAAEIETENQDVTNEPDAKTDDQDKATPTLETTQAEDEWILVEKSELRYGKRPRQHSPVEARKRVHHTDNELIDSSNNTNAHCHFHEPLLPNVDGSSVDPYDTSDSDLSSVTYPMMEESWLVTPPACFTAGTSKMETSSMENLLIEHPSMSVYHHRGRQSSTGVDSENSESSNDDQPSAKSDRCLRQAGLSRHEPPHRPRALATRIGLTEAKTVKSMQKSQQRSISKNLSQNNIRRSNRTHHSQGKVSRRFLVQQPRTRMITSSNKQH